MTSFFLDNDSDTQVRMERDVRDQVTVEGVQLIFSDKVFNIGHIFFIVIITIFIVITIITIITISIVIITTR